MVPNLERLLFLGLRYRSNNEGVTLLVCVQGLILIIAFFKESFTFLAHLYFGT